MRYGKLRIAFSVVCLIACALLMALWVRSYWWSDSLRVPVSGPRERYFYLNSVEGLFYGSPRLGGSIEPGFGINSKYIETPHLFVNDFSRFSGCHWPRTVSWKGLTTIYVPHWIPVLAVISLSIIPQLRYRFGLRTLLIATTLVAVVLGAIAYAAR